MQTLQEIINSRAFCDQKAETIAMYYNGDCDDLKEKIFPCPSYLHPTDYETLMTYFAYVNLCKPSVNRIVSGVYGGKVTRRVHDGSDYAPKVNGFLDESRGYSIKMREQFKGGILFGPGIQVFIIGPDKEVHSWLPNPIYTEIITDPFNVYDVQAIVEKVSAGDEIRYRYATKSAYGIADSAGKTIKETAHGIGIVPCTISYGEDTRMFGEERGRSLVKSSPHFSKVATNLFLNQIALILNYVRPQAVISGVVKNTDDDNPFEPRGVLEVDAGGKFSYETPETNYKDLNTTIQCLMANYCISESIPLDALDPSNIPENQSATSARLRNQPMSVTISRLVEEQVAVEVMGLNIVGALYQYIDTGNAVDFNDFRSRFKCSVDIEPSGSFESFVEFVTGMVSLFDRGVNTPEDMVRAFHGKLPDSEIFKRVQYMTDKIAEARDSSANQEANAAGDQPVERTTPDV